MTDPLASTLITRQQTLPDGVEVRALTPHVDARGSVTELYRSQWSHVDAAQWNFVRSQGNVLRGVHVHLRHNDYLIFIEGRAVVGLRDLRRTSGTCGLAVTVEMSGDDLAAISIPPGVAHGFYHTTPTLHIYAMSEEWASADELGCRWDDPQLEIDWPARSPMISDRDAALPSLGELEASVSL
jgi:dTDP-4-dehydrorhamnose 3,5-epimerase